MIGDWRFQSPIVNHQSPIRPGDRAVYAAAFRGATAGREREDADEHGELGDIADRVARRTFHITHSTGWAIITAQTEP